MKDLLKFSSSDLDFGKNLNKKIFDTRVNIKFAAKGRVTLQEYEVGIRDLPSDLRKAANKATDMIIAELGAALDSAMAASVWSWPGGSRDIIDTGALRSSRSIKKAGNGFTITYNQPYAAIVHYGGYIQPYGNPKAAKFYFPPRPWIDSVLNGSASIPQFDFESAFRKAFDEVTQKYS
jgi:phage gpG-like protein